MTTTRRQFLSTAIGSSAVVTFGSTAPGFLLRAAERKAADERILVVVQMSGGNDGLNTVVPFADKNYRKMRPKLAIPKSDVLKIDKQLGFHPSLDGFADLLEAGHLSIVQGVGYENPNHSHFESMDIWHTCQRKNEQRQDGWLGRFLQAHRNEKGRDVPAMHLGGEKQPFALTSLDVRTPSIRSLEEFQLKDGGNKLFQEAVKELAKARRTDADDLLGFLQTSTSSALVASERVEAVGSSYKASKPYPESELAKKLQTVARFIDSGMNTSIYYVTIDGFDTHAQQPAAHASLLGKVGNAVNSFVNDIAAHGHGERVLVTCFSEFGRRVAENASDGTDHGTAAPMFLAGHKVKPGVIGKHPSLTDLKNGDLKHHTDFRQVYATILENWLGCDSKQILKGTYKPVDALS